MTNFHGLLTLDNKLLQTDVSFLFSLTQYIFNAAKSFSFFLTFCVCLRLFNDNLVGRGGSRPRGAAEVSDM